MIALVNKVAEMGGLFGLGETGAEACRAAVQDKSLRLDHVGIAVRSIASSRLFYETIGMCVSAEEAVEHERVNTAMFCLGESRLELIEPMDEDSAVGRFLAKRGEGMHHIALHSDAVDTKFEALQAKGIRLASGSVRTGAGGHRYFFVHPASTGGVLIEIVGDSAAVEREPE